MISEIVEKGQCCGCSACYHLCPTSAITIKENINGFLNAIIDNNKCIKCNICDNGCPIKRQDKRIDIRCYAIKMHNNEELIEAQSGGAFFALSKYFLINKGVVYGVTNQDIRNVSTIRIEKLSDLKFVLKSKYVQSNCVDSFEAVEKDLQNGRIILYSGTACVIQGLKNYLRMKKVPTEKLFTCDLICHGVPSRLIDKDYLNYIEKKQKCDAVELIYRDKKLGWGTHFEKYVFSNGEIEHTNDKVIIFSKGYSLSPACFQCKYTTPYRDSDITIGDFWGLCKIGLSKQQFNLGLSICIIRSDYINEILLKLTSEKEIETTEVELKDAMQWNLEQPTTKPKDYENFWRMYQKNRFHTLKPVYFSLSFKEKLSRQVKQVLRIRKLKAKKE